MIREIKSAVPLRPCEGCHKPPLLCHDRRHSGSYFIDDPRCGRRTANRATPELAVADWGADRPRVHGVLALPKAARA